MPAPVRTPAREGLIKPRRSPSPITGEEFDACLGIARLSNRQVAERLGCGEAQVRKMISMEAVITTEIAQWARGLAADVAAADERNPAPARSPLWRAA